MENKKIDAGKLDTKAQQEKRNIAMKLRDKGMRNKELVDIVGVHHAKLVKAWEEENKDKIKLFYLPPYSPEFNPDEYLNQDYKSNVHKNGLPKNQKELKANTEQYMLELQKNTQKVANFFQHQRVKYAS